jgi:hypothetical protein
MRYMRGLNDWLARDVHDRHSELRGLADRIDDMRGELYRLGGTAALPPAGEFFLSWWFVFRILTVISLR